MGIFQFDSFSVRGKFASSEVGWGEGGTLVGARAVRGGSKSPRSRSQAPSMSSPPLAVVAPAQTSFFVLLLEEEEGDRGWKEEGGKAWTGWAG